jgi:pimeloyl-ACP methyl ester carboxylesterase
MIWLVIIYLVFFASFYFFQGFFFFQSVKLPADYKFLFKQPFKEVQIKWDSTTVYDVVQFETATDRPKGVVLYFHGNKENINHYESHSSDFTNNGYECWMVDYPGYGKSTGKITEEALKEQAQMLYRMAKAKFGQDSIVIYGKSLGTGIAAYLASKVESKMLVLETPYYNMESLARHYSWVLPVNWLLKVNFKTNEYISICNQPIVIFHGTNDGTVPYSNASRLKNDLKKGDRFVAIENGTHNDLSTFKLYKDVLDSLLK